MYRLDVMTLYHNILFVPLFVPGFEFCHQLFSGSQPSSRGTFCFNFCTMSRTSRSSFERSSSSTCTCWMHFPGSMYRQLSILLGLSPRSFVASCHGVLPVSCWPLCPIQGFVHFVETIVINWFQFVVCFGDDSHRRDACHSHHCEDRRDAETSH